MKRSDCPKENGSAKTGSPTMGTSACSKFTLDFGTERIRNEKCAEAVEFATKHNLELPQLLKDWQSSRSS